MSGYTLISSLGTGMLKKEGYRKTNYQFPADDKGAGEKRYESSLFLDAVLETAYRPIKKVILVGTLTSSWDVLIKDRDNEANADFWLKVKEECENKGKGISGESIQELEARLPLWYKNIPFKLAVHSQDFTPENVGRIFSTYLELPDFLDRDTDILFDITHGFRSMSLLVFQSLQLNASKISDRKVELLYGEYIEDEKISYVRDLSQYWDYYEISAAKKLFEEKFDGKLLAQKLKPYWESGAKILIRFSEIVECNFSLQIPEALKQLKNSLKDFSEAGKPQWLIDVKNNLERIYNKLSVKEGENYPVAVSVWEYSKLLRERKLITQAVIALQVVVETAIAEKYGGPEKIGNYVWFYGYFDTWEKIKIKGIGVAKLREAYKRDKTVRHVLNDLGDLRNQIAHGGGKDEKEEYPHQAMIKGRLKPVDAAIQQLFAILDQDV